MLHRQQPQITGSDFQQAADFLLQTVCPWQFATVANSLPISYGFAYFWVMENQCWKGVEMWYDAVVVWRCRPIHLQLAKSLLTYCLNVDSRAGCCDEFIAISIMWNVAVWVRKGEWCNVAYSRRTERIVCINGIGPAEGHLFGVCMFATVLIQVYCAYVKATPLR